MLIFEMKNQGAPDQLLRSDISTTVALRLGDEIPEGRYIHLHGLQSGL
jgi:hypothetical protein